MLKMIYKRFYKGINMNKYGIVLITSLLVAACSSQAEKGVMGAAGNDSGVQNGVSSEVVYETNLSAKEILPQVVRLTFRYADSKMVVTNARIVVANVSPQEMALRTAPLRVEAVSEGGAVLFEGGIHDPRHVRFEIEDDRQGGWQHEEIVIDETMFQVKIPYNKQIARLRIIENESGRELFSDSVRKYFDGSLS